MGAGGAGGMNMDDIFSAFGDIFGGGGFGDLGDIFGGMGGRRARKKGPEPHRGRDYPKTITITLQEAFLGKKEELGYSRFVECTTCSSKGTAPGTSTQDCRKCHGSGQMSYQQGPFIQTYACDGCNGQGFTIPNPCKECRGQTRIQKYDKFSVKIPAGVRTGSRIKVAGKGDAGIFGGPTGMLYLEIRVRQDSKFERIEDDLVCNVMLTYPQLVLGSQVEIESIDGTKELIKIPKGCAVGESIIVPGKGFVRAPGKPERGRGNLVVVTQCHVPKKITAEAKKALTAYSDIIGTEAKDSEGTIMGFFKKFLG